MATAPAVSIELGKQLALVDGWGIFVVETVGANIKRKAGSVERTTWATLRSPHDKELRVAVDFGSAGPLPEGVLDMEAVQVIAYDVMTALEASLDAIENGGSIEEW